MANAVARDKQPLVLLVRSRTATKVLSIGLLLRACCHVLGREVVERQQRFAILGQAGARLLVLRPVLGQEAVESSVGAPARLSA